MIGITVTLLIDVFAKSPITMFLQLSFDVILSFQVGVVVRPAIDIIINFSFVVGVGLSMVVVSSC